MKQDYSVIFNDNGNTDPMRFTMSIDIDEFGNIIVGDPVLYVPTLKDLWKEHVKETIPDNV